MKNKLFYLILFFMLVNCKDDKSQDKSNRSNEKIVSKDKLLTGWKTYSNDSIKVNIPSLWKPKIINDALLYIPLDEEKMDSYYVVLNYNVLKISCIDYIKETFKQVSNKASKFDYSLKKITFQNTNQCYILELYTNENKVNYKIYSIVYEVGNQIYDFSYKTLDDKKKYAKNKQTFYSVLFSFEFKYDNIIDSEKFIVQKEEILKYEDL